MNAANKYQQFFRFAESGKPLWVIFGIALLMRVIYLLQSTDNPLLYIPQLDEEFYVNFGRSLVASDSGDVQSQLYMDPLYGFFLGGIYYLFGDSILIPRVVQILTDSIAASLLFLIGRMLWSSPVGFFAGVLYAIYPVSWFYSLTLLKTTFITDFSILFTFLLVKCQEQLVPRYWFMLGLITCIGVYLRGNFILLIPITLLIPLFTKNDSLRSSIKLSVNYLVGSLIMLAMIGILNKTVFGAFSILPNTGGTTLYGANNPNNPNGENINPEFVTRNHPAEIYKQYVEEAEKRVGKSLSPGEVSSYWRGEAFSYWFSSPWVLPNLFLEKLGHLVTHKEIANNQSIEVAARFAPILLPQIPFYSFILAFGVPGLILALRKDRRTIAVLPVIFVVLVTTLIYFSSSRFRMPLVPVLILGSSYYLYYLLTIGRSNQKYWLFLIPLMIFVASMVVEGPPNNVPQQEINLALAHAEIGETDRAMTLLKEIEDKMGGNNYYLKIRGYISLRAKDYESAFRYSKLALATEPEDYGTMSIAGMAALELQDTDSALSLFTNALRISKDNEMHYWIGKTYVSLGDIEEAKQHLRIAVDTLPSNSEFSNEAKKLLLELQAK